MESATVPSARAGGYPVRYDVDYKEPLSRLSTFFRLILVIPQMIVLYVIELIAFVLTVIAWFVIIFTGQYPRGMFDFVTQLYRWYMNVFAYIFLLRDEYPPFSGADGKYAVKLEIDYPEQGLSRVTTFFRLILVIPQMIVVSVLNLLAEVLAFIAWFAILFTGKYPRGIFDLVVGIQRWMVRVVVYGFLVMTDRYPPFSLK